MSSPLSQVVECVNAPSSSYEEVRHTTSALYAEVVQTGREEPEKQEHILMVLSDMFATCPDVRKIVPISVVCGAIIELGYDTKTFADAVSRRLPAMLDKAVEFFETWQAELKLRGLQGPNEGNQDDQYNEESYGIANQVMQVMPEAGDNWIALETVATDCVLLFSRDVKARHESRIHKPLLNRIACEHEQCEFLSILLDVLDEEPLLVLEPATNSGVIGKMSGISDNAQLLLFMMELFRPQGFMSWLRTPRFPESLSRLIRGKSPRDFKTPVKASWTMFKCTALESGKLPDGNDSMKHWIWPTQEHTPVSIPVFDGYRVVLLGGPTSSPMTWMPSRMFPNLDADITIEKHLTKSEVKNWLSKLSGHGKH